MMPQQYCLRWKHHHTNVQNMFAQLLEKERFCDVTLYCSPSFATQVPNNDTIEPEHIRGVSLRAHRVVLAACSELLGTLLGAHDAQGEPVLVIDGAEPKHLRALLDYMYTGEMNVHHSQLASLLKTAEELRIKGLTNVRWNNKDEPPDCEPGVTATATPADLHLVKHEKQKLSPKLASPKPAPTKLASPKLPSPKQLSPKLASPKQPSPMPDRLEELKLNCKREDSDSETKEKCNGGPPPLIKLVPKEKTSPAKREHSDTDSPSPKRQRLASEHTDDETSIKIERDQEWQHGNLDISAERVVGWCAGSSRSGSSDEWDEPADIGSFLHTRLRVDGDNSADEESNESLQGLSPPRPPPAASLPSLPKLAPGPPPIDRNESMLSQTLHHIAKQSVVKACMQDPRFSDVVKLSDYLQHGRRPQFWEEHYVKRVMEAVRLKELEMKQAAEILGVSYGTLYGRYRDVYGCINRPYRGVREMWQAKGPAEVLEQLQRGDISLDAAARTLGVSIGNLAAHVADFGLPEKEFEPIPIEMDPSLKLRPRTYSGSSAPPPKVNTRKPTEKPKKVLVSSVTDDDTIPATVITTHEGKVSAASTVTTTSGKWPSIRVASLDSLREGPPPPPGPPGPPAPSGPPGPASPSALMRTRPDLTIVAARKPDAADT